MFVNLNSMSIHDGQVIKPQVIENGPIGSLFM